MLVIEEEHKIKLPYSCIGFNEEILQYKDTDKSLKQFIENTTNYIAPKTSNKIIPIDKFKKKRTFYPHK